MTLQAGSTDHAIEGDAQSEHDEYAEQGQVGRSPVLMTLRIDEWSRHEADSDYAHQ